MFQVTFFSFIKSRLSKIGSHVPSTVGPGKEGLASTLWSLQLDHVSALGSSFISFTASDKTLGIRPPPPPRHFNCGSPWGGCSLGISRETISSCICLLDVIFLLVCDLSKIRAERAEFPALE